MVRLLLVALLAFLPGIPFEGAGNERKISGTVVDSEGRPLDLVDLEIVSHTPGSAFKDTVQTSSDGRFEYELPAGFRGDVEIWASKEGYVTEPYVIPVVGYVGPVQLVLSKACMLRGTLTWPDGTPVKRARGRVSSMKTTLGVGASWEASLNVRDGRFEGDVAVTEVCRIFFTAEGKDGQRYVATAESVRCGDELDLKLGKGLTVFGRVVDDLGQIVPEFRVVARKGSAQGPLLLGGEKIDVKISHAEGSFELSGLTEGYWHVAAWSDTHSPSQAVAVDVGADGVEPVVLVLPRGATVKGRVVDEHGNGIQGAWVWSSPADNRAGLAVDFGSRTTNTGENGEFALVGVCVGGIKLRAHGGTGFGYGDEIVLTLKPAELAEDLVLPVPKKQ